MAVQSPSAAKLKNFLVLLDRASGEEDHRYQSFATLQQAKDEADNFTKQGFAAVVIDLGKRAQVYASS